jgi:hypothetical protein
MSTPYNNEERRFALRMSLRLPIVISGRTEDGSAWSEPTETDDISTSGALFHLNQKVTRGGLTERRSKPPLWSYALRRRFTAPLASACRSPSQPKTGCACLCRGLLMNSPSRKPIPMAHRRNKPRQSPDQFTFRSY